MTTPITINAVLAWARTKDPDEEYDYMDPCGCALAQFHNENRQYGEYEVDVASNLPGASDLKRLEYAAARSETFGEFVDHLEEIA